MAIHRNSITWPQEQGLWHQEVCNNWLGPSLTFPRKGLCWKLSGSWVFKAWATHLLAWPRKPFWASNSAASVLGGFTVCQTHGRASSVTLYCLCLRKVDCLFQGSCHLRFILKWMTSWMKCLDKLKENILELGGKKSFWNPSWIVCFFLFRCSFVSSYLQPHGQQCTRLPCPSLSPAVCSNSCPLNRWCHPTNSSSVAPPSPMAFNLSQH